MNQLPSRQDGTRYELAAAGKASQPGARRQDVRFVWPFPVNTRESAVDRRTKGLSEPQPVSRFVT